MAFMGNVQTWKGEFGVNADVFYADVGDDRTGTRDFTIHGRTPDSATADLSLDVKTTICTLAGTHAAVKHADYTMQLPTGVRMLNLDQTLNYSITESIIPLLPRGRGGSANVDSTNWDTIIGTAGRYSFSND